MEVISVQETHSRHTHFQHKDATILGAVDDDDGGNGDDISDDNTSPSASPLGLPCSLVRIPPNSV